ncbi:MAG: Mrp/NBP35 family ATP-binding protein [Dehalococcoidia bacterium]|nr:Mrp/NBP35 family ATP-binding protein [Dehalococcoidia bacterium]
MITAEQVKDRLDEVIIPHVIRSLTLMNLIRDITITDDSVKIALASAGLDEYSQKWITEKIEESLKGLHDIKNISIDYIDSKPLDLNKVGSVIAVMSGKGGVGKSLVSSITAVALRREGFEVGILDADITGASIPKMFGITERPGGNESGILPVTSKSGIEIMSINLLLPSEDEAVIWRGPLIGKAITQFWEEVLWGRLDYLIVDLPPGTADAPLTVMQSLPISGVIVVFTPQDLTAMIVRKAVKMARQMNKKILGVVENMSYLYVKEIDKKIELFGKSRGEEMATEAGAPLLGKIPVDPDLAALCDAGHIEQYQSDLVEQIGKSLLSSLSLKSSETGR